MQSEFCAPADTVSFANMAIRLISGANASPVTIMDMIVEEGGGAPLHKSLDEEKIFLLLAGQLDFTLAESTRRLAVGSTVTVARAEVHGFTNPCKQAARMLLVSTPARHDAFFRAMAALPRPHDLDAVKAICARYGQEIVGL